MAADDPASRFRRAERRLRDLLFGDGTYDPGIARGEETRGTAARELRRLREAFDAVLAESAATRAEQAEAKVAELEEELRRLAAATSRKAAKRTRGESERAA